MIGYGADLCMIMHGDDSLLVARGSIYGLRWFGLQIAPKKRRVTSCGDIKRQVH